MENYFLLENYVTSEGAVSHNVYYQTLPITRHQVRCYANNYFESLPIVSTAFNEHMNFSLQGFHLLISLLSLFFLFSTNTHHIDRCPVLL